MHYELPIYTIYVSNTMYRFLPIKTSKRPNSRQHKYKDYINKLNNSKYNESFSKNPDSIKAFILNLK